MPRRPIPDQDVLKSLLTYNPETGDLFWRERPLPSGGWREAKPVKLWNGAHAGKPAFVYVNDAGYRCGSLHGRSLRAHRIIWKMMTGNEPEQIDHINGDRADNRWCNLREVTAAENLRNVGVGSRNTSGFMGVYWQKDAKLWRVRIKKNGKNHQIGYFKNFEDAVAARTAALDRFGFHENHGRRAATGP